MRPFTAHTANKKIAIIVLTTLFLFFPLNATHHAKRPTQQTKVNCSKHKTERLLALQKSYECKVTLEEILSSSAPQKILTSNTSPFLVEHSDTICHAISLFRKTNGFKETLQKVIRHAHNPTTARGYLFEIETAISLEQSGESIVSFGRRHHSATTNTDREIDLETKQYWIECKNIYWEYLNKNKEKLEQQLCDEQQLMSERNERAERQKTFVIYSKQPIPESWQQWLIAQAIAYQCPPQAASSL